MWSALFLREPNHPARPAWQARVQALLHEPVDPTLKLRAAMLLAKNAWYQGRYLDLATLRSRDEVAVIGEIVNAVSCAVERQYLEHLYERVGGDLGVKTTGKATLDAGGDVHQKSGGGNQPARTEWFKDQALGMSIHHILERCAGPRGRNPPAPPGARGTCGRSTSAAPTADHRGPRCAAPAPSAPGSSAAPVPPRRRAPG